MNDAVEWRDSGADIHYGLVGDADLLAEVARVEQHVWSESCYGNLIEEGYGECIASSRTFAAFRGGLCIAVNRMFRPDSRQVPPFLRDTIPFHHEAERAFLIEAAHRGRVEELGTVAVMATARGFGVNTRLWRVAMRDARPRGIEQWGIIMEPERVRCMNRRYGFTFRQLGPTIDYQGGACAAHIAAFDEMLPSMQRTHPKQHAWFVRAPLQVRWAEAGF